MFRSSQPSSQMLLLLNFSSPVLLGKVNYKHKKRGYIRGNLPEIKKISCPGGNSDTVATVRSTHCNKSLFNEVDVVGILGGVSLSSTLTFLEKLVYWSARDSEAGQHLPFVLCNDPGLSKEILCNNVASLGSVENGAMVENLRRKRAFLERAGARCVVMPCHVSRGWYVEICKGCSAPFLHFGECVAREIKEANFKPIEAGSSCVRIGVIASDGVLSTEIYQENLQSQVNKRIFENHSYLNNFFLLIYVVNKSSVYLSYWEESSIIILEDKINFCFI